MIITRKLHAQWREYAEKFVYELFDCDMTDYGYVFLRDVDIEFEAPEEKELRQRAATALKAQAQAIRAKAFLEAQEKEAEAQKLLALEYTPVAETPAEDSPL